MRLRAVRIAITAAATLLASGEAAAEATAAIPQGARVRVTAPSYGIHREVGTVAVEGDRGIVVALEGDGMRVGLPHRDISCLEISQGRRPATAMGAVLGAALGFTWAMVTLPTPDTDAFLENGDMGSGDDAARFLGGGLVGAGIGALIGSQITVEAWRPVPWVGPWGRDREFGAGVRMGF